MTKRRVLVAIVRLTLMFVRDFVRLRTNPWNVCGSTVIAKMAFITVVDASTGAKVPVGADSAQTYYAISGETQPDRRIPNVRRR